MDGFTTVTESVFDSDGRLAWVVVASFIGVDGAKPRCVDYRVRVIGKPSTEALDAMWRLIPKMEAEAITEQEAAGLTDIPAQGIPWRVFEKASQPKLLAKARRQVERRPDEYAASVRQVLAEREAATPKGRPPSMPLHERLRLLLAVEEGYAAGRTRAEMAAELHMSDGALRDLLKRARQHNPPLFTNTLPGRRGGGLTNEARALLKAETQ